MFLRSYDFLDITKSVTKSQMDLYKEPNATWSQIGNKFYRVCWYNCQSMATVGLDIATYLGVSTLRKCGFFLPLPPEPPQFPHPHDNTEFLQNSIERALWLWETPLRREFEEGIETSFSERWNLFQAVGEWAIAYSFENMQKGEPYEPTFLTISEPLANEETFRSVRTAFSRLKLKEQSAVLSAIYEQKEMPSLSAQSKKVYQNIRALASKLHQGNTIYLDAFRNYQKQKEAGTLRTLTPAEKPIVYSEPLQRFDACPWQGNAPSAPSQEIEVLSEMRVATDIRFLYQALLLAEKIPSFPHIKSLIVHDRLSPIRTRPQPALLLTYTPLFSPKYFLARLSLLSFFKKVFQENRQDDTPHFIPFEITLRNGKSFRETGFSFARLQDADFARLQNALFYPSYCSQLSSHLREKMLELSEFGEIIHRSSTFLQAYEALRLSLDAE